MNNLYAVSPLLGFGLSIVLGALVIRQRPHSYLHRIFSLFLFSMGFWALTIYGMRVSSGAERALYWEKAIFAVLPIVSVSFYHFVLILTKAKSRVRILAVAYSCVGVAIALTPTDWLISGMRKMWYGWGFVGGPIFLPYLVLFYGIVVLGLFQLVKAYRASESPLEKSRFLYVALGAALCEVGLLFDVLAARGLPIYPMGILGNIMFSLLCAYAILKYNLLDLPVVMRRGAAYAVVSALGLGLVLGLLSFAYLFGIDTWRMGNWQRALFIIAIAVILQPFLRWVQGYVDRWFYRGRYDYLHALERLSDETKAITSLDFVAGSLVNTVATALQSRNVSVLLPDAEESSFVPVAFRGTDPAPLRLHSHSALVSLLGRREDFITRQDIDILPQLQALTVREREMLDKLEAEVFIPLLTREGLRGILILGRKLSEQDYSLEETRVLRLVARQMAASLDNARLYDLQKKRYDELALLARLSMIVSSELDVTRVCNLFVKELKGVLSVDYASADLVEESGIASAFVWTDLLDMRPASRPVVAREMQYEPDLAHEVRFESDRRFSEAGAGSVLRLPLQSKSGILGNFTIASRRPDAYNEENLTLLAQVAVQLAIGIDNSRLYDLERKARQELETQYKERTEFINSLIHEVKTPLTAMLASSELLREELMPETSILKELAENLDVASHNLDRRISELVDFVKFQNPETRLNLQPVDFNLIAQGAASQVSGLLRQKHQTLQFELAPFSGQIHADPDRLTQVLLNMLTNSSKFSEPYTVINLRAYLVDSELIVELHDSASPMAPDDAKLLFTPYRRSRKSSSGGLGLGLFICKKLVQLHGGRIWVETDSTGNRFKFSLPLVSSEGARHESATY